MCAKCPRTITGENKINNNTLCRRLIDIFERAILLLFLFLRLHGINNASKFLQVHSILYGMYLVTGKTNETLQPRCHNLHNVFGIVADDGTYDRISVNLRH